LERDKHCYAFRSGSFDLDIIEFYEMREDLKLRLQPVCLSVKEIAVNAHYASISTLNRAGKNFQQYQTRLRQALDIQLFILDGILKGSLNDSLFLHLNYPQNPKYHYLLINKLYFQSHEGYPVVKKFIKKKVKRSKKLVKGLYYYVLKEIVLKDEFKMLIWNRELFEFELYEFLARFNVSQWNEKTGELFDPEIDPQVMLKQLQKLQNINGISQQISSGI